MNNNPAWATFGGRVRWARENRKPKMSQKQLADAAGLSQPTISDIENGAEASRKTTSLAAALKVNPNWLESNRGLPYDAQTTSPVVDEDDEVHRADVVGEATMGIGGSYDLEAVQRGSDGFVIYRGPPGGVALRCKGNSMRPVIVPGMFVIVLEHKDPEVGDLVACQTKKDGKLMIKTLNWRRNRELELTSINETDQGPLHFFQEEIAKLYLAIGPVPARYHKENIA